MTTPQNKGRCSIQVAIHRTEATYLNKFNSFDIAVPLAQLSQLVQKYSERPIDATKLTPADRRIYYSAMAVYRPAQAAYGAVLDYEMLKILATVSELIHAYDMQDILQSAGDVNAVGRSLQQVVDDKGTSEAMLVAIGTCRKPNEQIPSESAKAAKALEKLAK